MFLTSDDILISLAAVLKQSTVQLAHYWMSIIRRSQEAAFRDIERVLSQRGFTAAQIAAWDDGPEFENHIALFWCLVNGGGLQAYDPTFILMFNRRKELASIEVTNAGVWQQPGGPTAAPGQVFVDTQERHNHGFGPLPHGRWGDESGGYYGEWYG